MYVNDGGGSAGAQNQEWFQGWTREVAESLISETQEGISVNWKEYWQTWPQRMYGPEIHHAFQELLLEKRVLSENPNDNFLVIVRPRWGQSSLVAIGPFTNSAISVRTVLFFTKLEYAKEWAEAWPGFRYEGKCEYYIILSNVCVDSSAVPVSPHVSV